MRNPLLLSCFLAVAACSPELPTAKSTISNDALDAPYPTLKPLPALLAQADAGSSIEREADALAARVARLKARANAPRGRGVIDGQTRLKLAKAVKAKGY